MCGIAGVLGGSDRAEIGRLITALEHRGPDGTGIRVRGPVHLAAARLAIIDPTARPQPVSNEAGTVAVVFNGEIYNYVCLRGELVQRGHRFATGTDTEVIVHAFEEWGEACVQHLHGMFAFAVDDGRRVFLARDRLGIKPLYYCVLVGGRKLVYASEIKAILTVPDYHPELDLQTFVDAKVLGHPVGDGTYFTGIRKLPPGHTMTVACDGDSLTVSEPQPYVSRAALARKRMGYAEAEARLEAALGQAVESHLAADVEVGLTLSGGLDSTLIALFAAERRESPLLAFTVADHADHPDVIQAGAVARLINAEHRVTLPTFDDVLDAIPQFVAASEQPCSLLSMPFFLACRDIAAHVKSCLHGEGADELFGGYSAYLDRGRKLATIRAQLQLLNRLSVSPSARTLEVIRRLTADDDFEQYLDSLFDVNLADQFERNHLDPVDQCGMAAGLEFRVPYLDDGLVELVTQMPVRFLVRSDLGIRKYILRRLAMRRFGPAVTDVVLREKLGVPASGTRLAARFAALCQELLPADYLDRHELGPYFRTTHGLLLFEMFCETFLVHRGDPAGMGSAMDFLMSRAGASARAVSGAEAITA
jgi:asparagine synthase (glutamine-hydrolysing)